MKRNRSGFLQGFGKVFEIIRVLVVAIVGCRYNNQDPDEVLGRLLSDTELTGYIAGIMVLRAKWTVDIIHTEVDYETAPWEQIEGSASMLLDEEVKFKKMEWKTSLTGKQHRLIHLIVPRCFVDPDEFMRDLRGIGLRPVDVFELASLVKSRQLEKPGLWHIVYEALGSPKEIDGETKYLQVYIGDGYGNFSMSKSQDRSAISCFPAIAI